MRKFLSLVLALVMMMSLVTINAGAKEFSDAGDITYDEAVDVISTVGVVDGYANGNFNPGGNLTRGAAAKIICNLILGPTTAAELHADTAPYRDVAVTHDFAGYIAYCQKEGIISGYADGTFRPGGTLTGYAFMKMLLGALGYDSEIEGYTGANWSINVAKRAIGIKLEKGLEKAFNGTDFITREEACLYAFNTLQADLVKYDQRITATVNGAEVAVGSSLAQSRKWDSQATRITNIRDDDIIQFAEEYFNKLEKKPDTDKFERPSYTWIYDKDEIGTYVNWDLLKEEYTTAVTGRELYDLLGGTTVNNIGTGRDNLRLAYYVDGFTVPNHPNEPAGTKDIEKADIARSNQDDAGISANGVLTQVFLDKDKNELTITSINTWLSKVTSEYNEDREYARVDVWQSTSAVNFDVDIEDVPEVEGVKEDEWYLVNISYKDNTRGEVVEMTKPEIMEQSAITKFSKSNSKVADKITTGGTEYKNDRNAYYDYGNDVLETYDDSRLTNRSYNIYMDQYGYFIGIDLFEGAKNYVFITGFDRPQSNLSVKTADANGIFLDGTMQEIKVNVTATDDNIKDINPLNTAHVTTGPLKDDGENYFIPWATADFSAQDGGFYALNRWFTYSVNDAGVYTLKPATRMTVYRTTGTATSPEVIKTANLYLDDNVMINGTHNYSDGNGGTVTVTGMPYIDVNNAPIQGHKLNTAAPSNSHPGYMYHKDSDVRVYGNDDSVYLTVDLDNVDTTAGEAYAITDVTGVYTGVQNVEIEVDPTLNAQEGHVYSVYDKNHYIIGSVVVGEGDGGNATIAYILDGAKSERIEDNIYYWEFEAIVDGEVQTLTLKDDYSKMFSASGAILTGEDDATHEAIFTELHGGAAVTPYTGDWNKLDGLVELRFDADKKYVTSVRDLAEDDIYSFYGVKDTGNSNWTVGGGDSSHHYDYVSSGGTDKDGAKKMDKFDAYRVGGVSSIATGGSTWTDGTTRYYDSAPEALVLKGRTLYVTPDQSDEGLALASDCKAVTIQVENGKWKTREHGSVASALTHLAPWNSNTTIDKSWKGEVVAALNSNGTAKWVVFTNYQELSTGNRPTPEQRDVYQVNVRYIDNDNIADNGNEWVAFLLKGTQARRNYDVTMEVYNTNGVLVSTRTITVAGQNGNTRFGADVQPTDSRRAFVGGLADGYEIVMKCEDGVGSYIVGTGSRNASGIGDEDERLSNIPSTWFASDVVRGD